MLAALTPSFGGALPVVLNVPGITVAARVVMMRVFDLAGAVALAVFLGTLTWLAGRSRFWRHRPVALLTATPGNCGNDEGRERLCFSLPSVI